jgi:hypothetical protein
VLVSIVAFRPSKPEGFAAIDPFLDLVGPMFELRCAGCHNADGKTPLTGAQIRIIEWWMAAGLPHETRVDRVELQPDAEVPEIRVVCRAFRQVAGSKRDAVPVRV